MSLLNTTIAADLESGAYEARLLSYKEVDDRIHKPYIHLLLEVNGTQLDEKLYESRIPYFIRSLRPQFGRQFQATSLEEILDLATKNDFTITIEYDPQYGRQISFSA